MKEMESVMEMGPRISGWNVTEFGFRYLAFVLSGGVQVPET